MKKIIKAYQKNKSPYLNMMMEEPNILDKDLENILIPVLLTCGEFDVITRRHTLSILKKLKYGRLHIYKGLDHGSHLANNQTF
jgi:pimeloyl-ACP methyl ester carboxylesterase